MDRPLNPQHLDRRRSRRLLATVAAVALVGVASVAFTGWVRPHVRRGDLRTARVDRGPVEATLAATGIVLPAYETVLVSPVDTRVARILRHAGDAVAAGDGIVELDRSEPEAALRTLDDQVALKRNAREQARLELENALTELNGRRRVKEIEQTMLEEEKAREARLVELGAMSAQAARVTEANLARVGVELAQVAESVENARHDLEIRLAGLDLEVAILQRERQEAARRLERTIAAAERPGVVTWVAPLEGASVRRGDEIARYADLAAYRVEASLSDVHAGRVSRGAAVHVRVGERWIEGRLTNVHPTVQDGVLTVEIALDDPAAAGLRPNLRVDVAIVTGRHADALRVARGSWLEGGGATLVFVVEGNRRAVRRAVHFGLQSLDQCEVLDGLRPGEEIILSDMSDYREVREVTIR